ncbi:hypothetical protein Q1695_011504 [Nippostrongylus brasiliensis]|nr:hypothetical protein Q1695_011504 [Nippostrongylus brasiliensis]
MEVLRLKRFNHFTNNTIPTALISKISISTKTAASSAILTSKIGRNERRSGATVYAHIFASISSEFIERNTLVMIATGPIGSYPGGQLLMGVFLGCFLTKIMILLNGFIYRYLRICRSPASQGYLQQREFFIFLVVNGLVILNWAAILYICFWPSPLLIRESRPIVMTAIGRDSHPAMLGVTMNQRFNLVVGALAETVALLSFLLVVVLYSWYRIRVTLKSVTVSQNSRNIQRQVSTLLFIQERNGRRKIGETM